MIACLYHQEEMAVVVLVTRDRKQFGVDIPNPGKIFQMLSGIMLAILCKETEVSLNGYLRVQMLTANDQKLRGAIFLPSEMERYWSKILIGRIDH